MDLRALRLSGIVVSGALIGAAAILAMSGRPAVRPAPGQHAPARLSPAPLSPSQSAPPQQRREGAAFAISLRGAGPLARAQRLAMRGGREAQAARRVERELGRQRAFRGLCFQHFTPRGDIVVHICGRQTEGVDWRARLRAMPAVTNVDAASQLTQDQRGD